jgi:predicted glycogen debranching enzyme
MTLPIIRIDEKELSCFEDAIKREWIVTNGLGGYASSTVLGLNTRKYHGLLVAALKPPRKRTVCLSKVDEEVIMGSESYPLGVSEFQNGIFPKGYLFLKEFSVSPFPRYVYYVQDVRVEKNLFLPYRKNAAIILYQIFNKADLDVKFRVYPLINWRHIHFVTNRWRTSFNFVQKRGDKAVDVRFGLTEPVLLMQATSGCYKADGRWIEKIYYREEAERKESCLDDCYQPGFFEFNVKRSKGENFAIVVVADEMKAEARKILDELGHTFSDIERLYKSEMQHRKLFLEKFYKDHGTLSDSDWLSWLVMATDMFVVEQAVIAGYHWFEVWGRDTFISLPGLMLVTGKFEDARKVFLSFKEKCKNGLIPNFLPDGLDQPVYNSVDASLWYVNAVLQYLKYTGDFKFVRKNLWETIKTIIEEYLEGTIFNIRADSDGLLFHDAQLTWMDTAINGQPVTPRTGKAVDVQALWYNALKTAALLAEKFGEKNFAEKYTTKAEKAKRSFEDKFWNAEKNYLFDAIDGEAKDDSLRPNQIIAVALDFIMLDNTENEKIVDIVGKELLTPYGLRTLSPNDPRYVGVYVGDRISRDKAYHNGTVWPWLLGPFTSAYLKVKGYADYRREYAFRNFLLNLFTDHVYKAGLGAISEIFDGDSPHTPRGCIAQGWSVAEPFRAYVEDIMLVRPKYEKEVLQFSL